MLVETARVEAQAPVQGEYRLLRLASPGIAAAAQPGQFVHLRVPGLGEAVLRRPFSIFRAAAGSLGLLYKTVGQGTRAMARLAPGDEVSLMGPLGHGFPRPAAGSFPVLVAGGYGMAALYLVAERAAVKGVALAGGRTAGDILCAADFRALGWEVRVATEDGSAGERGLVTDLLDAWLARELAGRKPELFACGPMGLLRALAGRAQAADWRAWLSLDRHMGCGVGACLACVQKIRIPRTSAGDPGWKWARICTEGPVFESRDILWDDREGSGP